MINIDEILSACEVEISLATKNTKSKRLVNLIKEGDAYRVLSQDKIEGEYLLSSGGLEDQAVSIEWAENNCYISGINSEELMFRSATIQRDETALLRAVSTKLQEVKAGDNLIKDPVIIVGPPGTGKTKVIARTIEEGLLLNKRILVVSPTNMAVENVFEKLDFPSMGLVQGDALLTIRTENEALMSFAPSVIAASKLKPINDELELLEYAMSEIHKTKRDADTMLASLSAEEERTSIALSNLRGDEARAKEVLKKASLELRELDNRLNMINSNSLIKAVAGAFLGTKIAEIEAERTLAQASISSVDTLMAAIEEKKQKATSDRANAVDRFSEAREVAAQADASQKEVSARIKELKKEKEEIIDLNLFGTAKLVGSTLYSAALNKKIFDAGFDMIIIDEVGMASLPTLALACKAVKQTVCAPIESKLYEGLYEAQSDAVNKALSSQFVFVGDPQQLSPIARTSEMKKTIFEVYGVEKIFKGEAVERAVLLDINFRNHPDIVELSSRLFYGGLLKSGRPHNGKKSLFIRNVKGACTSFEGSYVNHGSANAVFEQTSLALGKGRRSIGVITPYRKQAENIDYRMNELREAYPDANMQAGTVHKFQGKEKGVVMFDITASSGTALPATYTGDIKSEAAKLLNVAMTRAEDFFILVGDVDGLEKQLCRINNYQNLALWQWIVGIKELAYN